MKQKRSYATALDAAHSVVEWLMPNCDRIEIAGSLRRRNAEIGDIEIVAIPTPVRDLFGEPTDQTLVNAAIYERAIACGKASSIALIKNGPKMKQFAIEHDGQRYQVDLFLAQPANWGLIYMIRTGSTEFSRRMMTVTTSGGYKPANLQIHDGQVWRSGQPVLLPEERDLFALWCMDYVEPERRI